MNRDLDVDIDIWSTLRSCGVIALLLLASGCVTARRVNLDTGHGAPLIYRPVDTEPIGVGEAAFKRAVAQLVLDMKLNVMQEFEEGERLSLLASAGGVVDGVRGRTSKFDPTEPRMVALSFAFDTVWEGVEEAVKGFADPEVYRAMVVSVVGTTLVMLVAPEPITKLVAVALTASLIAYLGTGPVWALGQGFLRLVAESKNAHTLSELRGIGHRFGRVLGSNGVRVLIIAALAVLGGNNATAAQGARLPGLAQASLRARVEGGFLLSEAWAGGVQSIAIPSTGVLNVALVPAAVAAVALGPGSAIQGDPEGDVHHICT
ncbi:MAG: hypothetical protein ABW123_19125, partial [Cystobacter sp.]